MSILRRRSSHASQGQLCNDEAGIHMPRPFSAHELLQNMEDKSGLPVEEDVPSASGGPVQFTLEEDEEVSAPLATFSDSGDLGIVRTRKSSFKAQNSSDDTKIRSRKVIWQDSKNTAAAVGDTGAEGVQELRDLTLAGSTV